MKPHHSTAVAMLLAAFTIVGVLTPTPACGGGQTCPITPAGGAMNPGMHRLMNVGQPITGVSVGIFRTRMHAGVIPCYIQKGFAGVLEGDFDDDGDVDLDDYLYFVDCLAGPEAVPTPPPPTTAAQCVNVFDADGDEDVDLQDFAAFAEFFGS